MTCRAKASETSGLGKPYRVVEDLEVAGVLDDVLTAPDMGLEEIVVHLVWSLSGISSA